jgi:RNA polymerase sigma factor (sigma-70 family)
MSDSQLAVLSQGGSHEAFNLLARRWGDRLYRFLHCVLGDAEEARETSQETWLRAWKGIRSLRRPEHFKAWLHQIALNQCRDRGRSAHRGRLHEVELDQALADQACDPGPTPIDGAEVKSLASAVAKALALLPLEQREALLLRELESFTSIEIASVLGVPAATVRSRIFYALKAVRRSLHDQGLLLTDTTEGRVRG